MQLLGSCILDFGPCAARGNPELSPVGKDDMSGISGGARIFFLGGGLGSFPPSLPFSSLPPFPLLSPFPPSLSSLSLSRPSQAGSQDCQNEEADRSSAPPLPCPPLPCPPVPFLPLPLEVGPLKSS